MSRKASVAVFVALLTLALGLRYGARAAASSGNVRAMITEPIDASHLVTLVGNTGPEANARNDRGRVSDSFALDHMLLQLKRAPDCGQLVSTGIRRNSRMGLGHRIGQRQRSQLGEQHGLVRVVVVSDRRGKRSGSWI